MGLGLLAGIAGSMPACGERERDPLCTSRVSPASEGPRVRAEDTVIRERGTATGKWGNGTAFPRGAVSCLQDAVIVKLKKKKKD